LKEKGNNLTNNEKPLSPKTVSDIVILINCIFNYAFRNKHIENPIHISAPKNVQNRVQTFNIYEKSKMQEYIFKHLTHHGMAILLCLYVGLRIGEVCALKWENIDFTAKCLYVLDSIQRIKDLSPEAKTKTKVIIDIPKTESSIREIPLPDFLLPVLARLKGDDTSYIATNTARYIEPRLMQKKYKTILKRADIEYKNFHVLRHTFATDSYNKGMNIKNLSEILGHSDIKTTLRLYVHTSMEQKRKEINYVYADMTA